MNAAPGAFFPPPAARGHEYPLDTPHPATHTPPPPMPLSSPVVASYCTTFLKREMAHIYRQVTGLRNVRTFVMARTRENADRYPFDDVELVGKPPKNFLRHFWLKHVRGEQPVVYRGEFGVLDRILRRREAEMMHIYFGHTGVHLLPFIKVWDKPCVVSFHGADVAARDHQPGYADQLRELLETVPLVLARSESLRRCLIDLGCPPERVVLNRTGIPLDQFPTVRRVPPEDGRWQLVQACRLIEKKGLFTTLAAFAEFGRIHPKATLVLAGDGPLRAELAAWVAAHGLERRVRFRGFLSHEKLYALYVSSHLFVHPSERLADGNQEGVPNSLLEAMASGLPVVATVHGGIPEAVTNGVDGLLVPERDPAALCAALCQLAAAPDRWAAMGQRAAATVAARFEGGAQIAALEAVYRQVLRSGAAVADNPAELVHAGIPAPVGGARF